jgi:hypothetical protein
MPTPYDNIENLFLGEIKDTTLLDYIETERINILDGYLLKAITRFKACQKDLSDKNDILKQFNQTLTDEEKLIIATCMRKFWLNDKIYNLELLKQRMSTKDWKLTSQAEHLKNLTTLRKDLEEEISRMIVNYTVYAYEVNS